MSSNVIERIYRSILWLEESHEDAFYVESMADIACLSPYHFSRVFYSMTGMSPALYSRRRYLTIAANKLSLTDKSILDVALDAGYDSQESFTRAFKKMFHVNPGGVRKSSVDLEPLSQKILKQESLEHFKAGGLNLQPEYKEHDGVTIYGVAGRIDYDGTWQANKIWEEYFNDSLGKNKNKDEILYGVCQGTFENNSPSSQLMYLAGGRVCASSQRFESINIQEGTYAVFTHNGALKDIETTLQYIWQIWVPRSGVELVDAPDFEGYNENFDQEKLFGEIQIWIPIISK